MITVSNENTKLIRLTDGNIRNSTIPVTGLRDFLPSDCFEAAGETGRAGKTIRILLEGLGKTIETGIGRDAKTGQARRQFRARGWIRKFFAHCDAKGGDVLELRRLGNREYCLRVCRSDESEEGLPGPFRAVEFFAGIGLVRLALERSGFKVVFANDIDPEKLRMYADNFPAEDFRLGDIRSLDADDIPDCDLATASFPCTDLSIAGEMNGIHSGESSAFWPLIELLGQMGERRPRLLLLENVPGFLMSHGGRDFESALVALNELGYACDAFMIDAAHFVPQSRLRLFVVGKLGVEGESPFGLSASALRPSALAEFIAGHPEIRWDLRPLPAPPTRSARLEAILEDLPEDHPAWWSKTRADYFVSQFSERHAKVARAMIDGASSSYGTAFRRVRKGRSMAELRTDGLAGCLRTPKGGSGRQILFKAGKGRYQVRLLTARECARLQGVPDSYRITVSLNQALFGFGDAVCVPAIEWIADRYLLPAMMHLAASQPD